MKIEDQKMEPFFIEHSNGNYDLNEKTGRTDKKGNEIIKTIGHFSSVQGAFKKLVRLKVEQPESVYTIKEYIEQIKKVSEEIIKID